MLSRACIYVRIYALACPARCICLPRNRRTPNHGASPMARAAGLGDRPHIGAMSRNMALMTDLRRGYLSWGRLTVNANPVSEYASLDPGRDMGNVPHSDRVR